MSYKNHLKAYSSLLFLLYCSNIYANEGDKIIGGALTALSILAIFLLIGLISLFVFRKNEKYIFFSCFNIFTIIIIIVSAFSTLSDFPMGFVIFQMFAQVLAFIIATIVHIRKKSTTDEVN